MSRYLTLSPAILKQTVNDIVNTLGKYEKHFQYIAWTGNSGSLVGPSVCMRMNKLPLILRKPRERYHGNRIEFISRLGNSAIFLDDLCDSGRTLRRVLNEFRDNFTLQEIPLKGIYFYRQDHAPGNGYASIRRVIKSFNLKDLQFVSANTIEKCWHNPFDLNDLRTRSVPKPKKIFSEKIAA